MKINKKTVTDGYRLSPQQELRRSVMACMLWETEAYESGEVISDRIAKLVPLVDPALVASMAIEAREKMKLRHVPLLLVREMARHPNHKRLVKDTLARVIQRADELAEFMAIYWKQRKQPIAACVKKGLAQAFNKFDEYQLAKYNRDADIRLRDVLFLCHAKPADLQEGAKKWTRKERKNKIVRAMTPKERLFSKLVNNALETPDTWEVALAAGKDKKSVFLRLMDEKKLGAMAFLRNLRQMVEAGIDADTISCYAAQLPTDRILPFRFIAAARHAPRLEPILEQMMFSCLTEQEKLPGNTALLVDVSGSMDHLISHHSQMRRVDAAYGLAVLLREVCESVEIFSFSHDLVAIPPRRGFALRDAIDISQSHGGTYLGAAIKAIKKKHDRLIVITDEQSADNPPTPDGVGYIINVASNKNGVGYGVWTHIDGWSEAVIDYIRELERSSHAA